jgi:hypothetical protein
MSVPADECEGSRRGEQAGAGRSRPASEVRGLSFYPAWIEARDIGSSVGQDLEGNLGKIEGGE